MLRIIINYNMSPTLWGPNIWSFIHTLVEKIKEDQFNHIGYQTFNIIKQICKNLPCPYCATDATNYLNRISLGNLKTNTKGNASLQKV